MLLYLLLESYNFSGSSSIQYAFTYVPGELSNCFLEIDGFDYFREFWFFLCLMLLVDRRHSSESFLLELATL